MSSRSHSFISPMDFQRPSAQKAFTLIELLVVIGIIAILAGGIGVAMRDGNPSAALQEGQSVLASLLASARGQAALKQANAMVIVDADTTSETFLRAFQVVVETPPAGSNTWQSTGAVVTLPQGVYMVPKTTTLNGVTLSDPSGAWKPKRISTALQDTTAGSVSGITTGQYLKFVAYTSLGTLSTTGNPGNNLLIAAGKRTSATAITLGNSDQVRGLQLSKYGIATLVNVGSSFDN